MFLCAWFEGDNATDGVKDEGVYVRAFDRTHTHTSEGLHLLSQCGTRRRKHTHTHRCVCCSHFTLSEKQNSISYCRYRWMFHMSRNNCRTMFIDQKNSSDIINYDRWAQWNFSIHICAFVKRFPQYTSFQSSFTENVHEWSSVHFRNAQNTVIL